MTQRSEQMGETLIGAVVIAVAVGFLVFAVARAGAPAAGSGYPLVGRFDRADGIAVGADVRVSGVKVGSVSKISLNPEDYQAKVEMTVASEVQLPEDSAARIASDGLLGGAFVSIEPGGSETMLPANGEFADTQGSVDLLTLFASFARGQGGQSSGAASTAGDPSAEPSVAP